jgi:hypothetical protein
MIVCYRFITLDLIRPNFLELLTRPDEIFQSSMALKTENIYEVQCDSKLLSGFPCPIIFKPEITK